MTETEQMIQDCINRQEKMSEWEQGFVQSLEEKGSIHLTAMQLAKLEQIWERIT